MNMKCYFFGHDWEWAKVTLGSPFNDGFSVRVGGYECSICSRCHEEKNYRSTTSQLDRARALLFNAGMYRAIDVLDTHSIIKSELDLARERLYDAGMYEALEILDNLT